VIKLTISGDTYRSGVHPLAEGSNYEVSSDIGWALDPAARYLRCCGSGILGSTSHSLSTPETESAFFKNYTPKTVIERFDAEKGSSYGQHSGGGAGRKFVTHTGGFDWYFAMRSDKWVPLINALRDDASAQLVANGAQILSQTGDARDGFHFDKTDKTSLRNVRIEYVR
jgi:hypothetical protein